MQELSKLYRAARLVYPKDNVGIISSRFQVAMLPKVPVHLGDELLDDWRYRMLPPSLVCRYCSGHQLLSLLCRWKERLGVRQCISLWMREMGGLGIIFGDSCHSKGILGLDFC